MGDIKINGNTCVQELVNECVSIVCGDTAVSEAINSCLLLNDSAAGIDNNCGTNQSLAHNDHMNRQTDVVDNTLEKDCKNLNIFVESNVGNEKDASHIQSNSTTERFTHQTSATCELKSDALSWNNLSESSSSTDTDSDSNSSSSESDSSSNSDLDFSNDDKSGARSFSKPADLVVTNSHEHRSISSSSSDSSSESSSETSSIISDVITVKPETPRRPKKETWVEEIPASAADLNELPDSVDETVELCELGVVNHTVEQLAVIQANRDTPALDIQSVLFNEERQILGLVCDVFGPVVSPFYAASFKDIHAVKPGLKVFFAPKTSQWTTYVFTEQLRRMKFTDASWESDEECPPELQDFSDDEKERQAKAKWAARGRKQVPSAVGIEHHKKRPRKNRRLHAAKAGQQTFPHCQEAFSQRRSSKERVPKDQRYQPPPHLKHEFARPSCLMRPPPRCPPGFPFHQHQEYGQSRFARPRSPSFVMRQRHPTSFQSPPCYNSGNRMQGLRYQPPKNTSFFSPPPQSFYHIPFNNSCSTNPKSFSPTPRASSTVQAPSIRPPVFQPPPPPPTAPNPPPANIAEMAKLYYTDK